MPLNYEVAARTLDDIHHTIYYCERLVQIFRETYFDKDEESFDEDEAAKRDFVYNYENMSAMLHAIEEMTFQVRLKSEIALGVDSRIVQCYIYNTEQELATCKEVRGA